MRYTALSTTSSTSFCGQHVQLRCFCIGLANCYVAGTEPHRDRKSTRLNSSHGYISYAVFCLKKKNNIHKHINPAELQSAFIPELAHDPQLKSQIRPLRQLCSHLAATLQTLSASVAYTPPHSF